MNAPLGFVSQIGRSVPTGLFLGNATVLADMPPAIVDMAYLDPPFGNRQMWSGKAGRFDDRWRESDVSHAGWDALRSHNLDGAVVCECVARSAHDRGYLGFVAGLLVAVHRSLKPTGSLWLHFDDTMGTRLRIVADAVFGLMSSLGTVVWKRSNGHKCKGFARVHDTIAVYPRTRATAWRLHRCGASDLVFGDPAERRLRVDGFCEDRLNSTSRERVGYPTQKPVSLLSRFIAAATLPGDLILDPTCGSGTTLVAAARLGRRALGIDVSAEAIACASARLGAA